MTTEKKDNYQIVTDLIMETLEKGVIPWDEGYSDGNFGIPLRHDGKGYRGINILILWCEAIKKGFSSDFWMTFKQAQELKASVKKGEKASVICHWNTFITKDENDEDVTVPFLKTYKVLNANQSEGLPNKYLLSEPRLSIHERIDNAEIFIKNTSANIEHTQKGGRYYPTLDKINVPHIDRYERKECYYATTFHELGHWTGHQSRLNRVGITGERTEENYAFEELVAELTAAYTLASLGITKEPLQEHAGYIDSWLGALKQDKRFIFKAATQAQNATEYLKSLQPGYQKEDDDKN